MKNIIREDQSLACQGQARIACLEADLSHAETLCELMVAHGYECQLFQYGRALIRVLQYEHFDLLVLDWYLPDINGLEVIRWVRTNLGVTLPVVLLAGCSQEADIVMGLEVGADCVTKPERQAELLARIWALLRRSRINVPAEQQTILVGDYQIDIVSRRCFLRGEPVELTCREFELTALLFRHHGRVLPRDYVAAVIWGLVSDSVYRTIATHMSRIRTRLRLGPEHGVRLTSIYAHGWRFDTDAAKYRSEELKGSCAALEFSKSSSLHQRID